MASIGIIGAGKVGSTLANEFEKINSLAWVVARNTEFLNDSIESQYIIKSIQEITTIPDFIFITVQDNKILDVIEELIDLGIYLNGSIVIHCSGFLRKGILTPIEKLGCRIAACHPYQTFYYPEMTKLKGIGFAIECDSELQIEMQKLVESIGGVPYFFNESNIQNKEFYHLSAVAISNFLTPLLQLGKRFADIAGIDANVFFKPILEQTIQNNLFSYKNSDYPLTGTIARKDENGLKIHLETLKNHPELLEIFKSLTLATLKTSLQKNAIDEITHAKFINILENTNQ